MKLSVIAQIISKFAIYAWQDMKMDENDFEYLNKILPSWLVRNGISYEVRGEGTIIKYLTNEQAAEFTEFCQALIRAQGSQIWDDGVVDREDYKNLSETFEQTFTDYLNGEPITLTVTKTFAFTKEEK